MAATFTSSGTWTALTTSLLANTENVPSIKNEYYSDFGTPIPEVTALVQLVADGYSTASASVPFWVAANFLRQQLTSLMNGEVPKAANS